MESIPPMALKSSLFPFLQINFTKTHKKVLICPENDTVTLLHGKIIRANFKTMSFASLATHRFSEENFHMLKYVTAALKCMALKLEH